MKIDMSAKEITNRLKTVNQFSKACLSLANSSAGKRIREQFSANRVAGGISPPSPHTTRDPGPHRAVQKDYRAVAG